MVKIEVSNRALYTFITAVILINIIALGFAFGGNTPSTLGHSAGEIDTSAGFSVTGGTLSAIDISASGNVQAASITTTTGDICTASNCLNSVVPAGIPTFRFCTNSQSKAGNPAAVPECVVAASNKGTGDNNNIAISCKKGGPPDSIRSDLDFGPTINPSWRYYDNTGTPQTCIDGSTLIVSF